MKTLILLACACMLLSCTAGRKKVHITDVSRDTTFVVKKNRETSSSMRFQISGEVDDTCRVMGVPVLPGKVDTSYQIDFYQRDSLLIYQAGRAKKGSLEITYSVQ